jgi:hypothetical protein
MKKIDNLIFIGISCIEIAYHQFQQIENMKKKNNYLIFEPSKNR